jgi:uncharacterized protein YpmB
VTTIIIGVIIIIIVIIIVIMITMNVRNKCMSNEDREAHSSELDYG